MNGRDYYQVLGVTRQASPAELRAAFVRLAKRYHPDMAQPDADLTHRLREVQQAYRCLSDFERRAEHDCELVKRERLHFATQRAIHRRLRSYDRRHPHRPPRPYRRVRWRSLLAIACGAAIVVQVSVRLLG